METAPRSSFGGRASSTPRIPLSGSFPVTAEKDFCPVAALNPFQTQNTIRVKVAKIYRLRRCASKREPQEAFSLFNALLIDDQATEIEATFWREAAELYHERLTEGKVYYFTNFSVKNANKKYSVVENDYCLSMDARTRVEEAMDQDTSNMTAKVELTDFTDLPKCVDQQSLVNVLGVVTHVAAASTVKRRTDHSELMRRDITLVDKSMRTINVTFWGDQVEEIGNELEENFATDAIVLLLKNVRVSSFNGISLTTVSRTEVDRNPELPQVQELKDWYDLVGRSETLTPLADGIPNTRVSGKASDQAFLSDVDTAEVPGLDEKPTYVSVQCSIVNMNPEQTMYYLANKKNNRKVVEQDGQYYCEFDGQLYDTAELRYVFSMRIADFTKTTRVSIFNEQAEELLGLSASDLDEMRKDSEEKYKACLRRCLFKPLMLRIMSKAREQQTSGEVELRHTVVGVKEANFVEETQHLLSCIQSYTTA